MKTAATHSNLATYCLTNAAANDKCGVCTDLAAASNKCNLFKYTGLAIADEATALTQCKSCVTTTDFIHLSGTGVLYGTCIANTATATKAACGDNNYAIFETNPASPLTYCGSASTASSKCIICKAATKCKVFSYYDGVASTATA